MSGMTDARALELVESAIDLLRRERMDSNAERLLGARNHIASRLRGEAQAEQQAVGEAGTMPGTDGFTMACFKANDVPVGTPLYTRPQAALSSTAAPAIGDPINADSDADYLRKLGDRIGGDCGAVLHTIAVGLDAPAPVAGDAVERAAAAIFECDSGQPWSAATTREREIMTRFARAALAQDRASKSAPVDTSTNEAWIARAESKLAAGVDVSEAAIFRAADALCGKWNLYYPWNLHYPDAVSMAKTALTAAALRTGGGA